MEVTEEGFASLARVCLQVAHETCGDRLIAVLEGGYDLVGLTRSVQSVLGEMAGENLAAPVSPPKGGDPPSIRRTREIARHYWGV
jgi:acetoin utilization deacetylase AcuC-like enzyme